MIFTQMPFGDSQTYPLYGRMVEGDGIGKPLSSDVKEPMYKDNFDIDSKRLIDNRNLVTYHRCRYNYIRLRSSGNYRGRRICFDRCTHQCQRIHQWYCTGRPRSLSYIRKYIWDPQHQLAVCANRSIQKKKDEHGENEDSSVIERLQKEEKKTEPP